MRIRRDDDAIAFADMGQGGRADSLNCSFCGKSRELVQKLIAGPGVYICDECIYLCVAIIEDELQGPEPQSS